MSDLTPELADKVLAANLRNIVKKIGDGGTLSPAERDIMEQAKHQGLLSAEILRARRAALVRKYALGHRLNSDEHTEIASVIPATHVVVKKVTTQTYRYTLGEYAEQFIKLGMENKKDNARKLKGWIADGRNGKDGNPRDEPDLPPFDQPAELATWWRRNKTYKPPDWMIAVERSTALDAPPGDEAKAKPASSADAPPAQQTEAGKKPASDLITTYGDLQIEGELANDFTVKIIAGAAMDNLRRYNEAREREDWRAARAIREELIEDVKALQKAKLEAQKLLATAGDYLRRLESGQALNLLLAMQDTSIANAFEDILRTACPQMDPDARRDLALTYRDRVFQHWHETEFGEVWTPTAQAA